MTERIVDQPLRCITYSRVSTKGQVERGFSLGHQGEATWAHAEAKGYEIEDAGYSGADLERPGTDRVRDLVEAGDIDLVLVQEFELCGCEIRGWTTRVTGPPRATSCAA